MADYVSALNGQQMDEALTDVALRNSEAWAVGTRNGVNVTSADETYHNNAKYYAQVAQSAIPGTYTAAVRWDIAQGLAGEAQEQARANISAGASNRNLLDNPWFTVNQRGFTSSTATNNVYSVDRWKINNGGGTGGTVSVTSEGYIQLTTGNASYISYQQMFGTNELAGRPVTISINESGNISSYSFTVPARTASTQIAGTYVFKEGCGCNFFTMSTGTAYGYIFQLSIGQGYSATIHAVKLELGSYSTLANDVAPNYKAELDKCQYYCRVLEGNGYNSVGMAVSATEVRVPFPFAMRATPTISTTGSVTLFGATSLTPSAVAVKNWGKSQFDLGFTVTGATAKSIYLFAPSSGKIVLSADL